MLLSSLSSPGCRPLAEALGVGWAWGKDTISSSRVLPRALVARTRWPLRLAAWDPSAGLGPILEPKAGCSLLCRPGSHWFRPHLQAPPCSPRGMPGLSVQGDGYEWYPVAPCVQGPAEGRGMKGPQTGQMAPGQGLQLGFGSPFPQQGLPFYSTRGHRHPP